MLHLIYHSPIDKAVLQRIECADDVVFFEGASLQLNKNGQLNIKLQKMLNNGINLHVLAVELETRGVSKEELSLGIKVIDYPYFVELTENSKVIKTWN